MTLTELREEQAAAGAAYADAARAYYLAGARLAAADRVLSKAAGQHQPSFTTFPEILMHPRFLADAHTYNGAATWPEADARAEELVRALEA